MLVDTNILIYALNEDSEKHSLAKQFLQYPRPLEIAHQNIFEALRVLTHPKATHRLSPHEATTAILAVSKLCNLIHPNGKTLYIALELTKKYQISGSRIFDAYLAATALSNDVDTIATDNLKDFKRLGITVFNPFLTQ